MTWNVTAFIPQVSFSVGKRFYVPAGPYNTVTIQNIDIVTSVRTSNPTLWRGYNFTSQTSYQSVISMATQHSASAFRSNPHLRQLHDVQLEKLSFNEQITLPQNCSSKKENGRCISVSKCTNCDEKRQSSQTRAEGNGASGTDTRSSGTGSIQTGCAWASRFTKLMGSLGSRSLTENSLN